MGLQSSGAISLDNIHEEAGGTSGSTCTINDADIRGLISASDGANTSFDDWYGASSAGDVVLVANGMVNSNPYYTDTILQLSIATNGQNSDFGNLNQLRKQVGSASSSTRGLFHSGYGGTDAFQGRSKQIDYVTIASAGNASDFGDVSDGNNNGAGASNNTRAIFKLGYAASAGINNIMEYVTIANTGNSTDFGDATYASYAMSSTNSTTRACFAGGDTSTGYTNIIDYVTIANTGNATDFGNLTTTRTTINKGSVSSGTYGFFTGGVTTSDNATHHVDYITIASAGNAGDFGDLNREIKAGFQSGNKVKGLSGGGYQHTPNNQNLNLVQRDDAVSVFTLGTSGSGSDWGDMSLEAFECAGISDDHGGIG